MILHHIEDHQIFNTDNAKSLDDLTALLMGKIVSLICNPLVSASNYLLALLSFFTTIGSSRQFFLGLRQVFLFFAKKAGIINFFASAESSEVDQIGIQSCRFHTIRQW